VEILQNVPMLTGNTFLGRNKITEYFFDQVIGGENGRIRVFISDAKGGGTAPFPETVTNGTVTVEFSLSPRNAGLFGWRGIYQMQTANLSPTSGLHWTGAPSLHVRKQRRRWST
jgi:hypothetical protein